MKTKDTIENYLIELGISLKNNYIFIPKTDYQYSLTKGKSETVELGNYEVKLDKILRNSRELIYVTNIAKNNFINTVTLKGDVGKACEKLISNSILYYGEFAKYIINNLDIKSEFAEKLISLVKGSIDSSYNEVDKIVKEFNVKMEEARQDGDRHHAELTANAIAEANKVKGIHTNIYNNNSLFGESYTIHATPITTSDAKRREMLSMASGAAAQLQSIYEDVANDKAIENLRKVRSKIINDFNNKFKELISVKLNNYFDENIIDNTGKNIEDNPAIYSHYIDLLDNLKEEQINDFKRVIEYYGIYLLNDLEQRVEDNIFNSITKDNSFDYNKSDYKLYLLLKGKDFEKDSNLSKRIFEYYTNLKSKGIKENKVLISTFGDKKKLISECKYLTEDDKSKLVKALDDFTKLNAKNEKLKIFDITMNILIIIMTVLGIFISIKYAFMVNAVNDSIGTICVFGIPISVFIIFLILRNND